MELIDAASAEFARVVRQLPADSWEWPTPSLLSVRELIEHVVVGNRFTALLLAGVDRDVARTMVVEPHLDEMLTFGAYGAGPSGTLRRFTAESAARLVRTTAIADVIDHPR